VEHCYTYVRPNYANNHSNFTLIIGKSRSNIQNGIKVGFEIRNGYYEQMMKSIGFGAWVREMKNKTSFSICK